MVMMLNWSRIVDLILTAQYRLYLIMPSVHNEWYDVVQRRKDIDRSVDIRLCINNSEKIIRNGYGSIDAIDNFKKNNFLIMECKKLYINFLCIDNSFFALFLESRNLSGNLEGYNAIQLDQSVGTKIIDQFFSLSESKSTNEFISQPLDLKKFEEIHKAIELNPPSEPDLLRQIDTYKTYFQYADIHFEGGRIENKKVFIPQDTPLFKDRKLSERIKTSFNLFTKEDTEKWSDLSEIKLKVEEIRSRYLVSCKIKRGRNILKKVDKAKFNQEIEVLIELVNKKKDEIIDSIQQSIYNSTDLVKEELRNRLETNPPQELLQLKTPENRARKLEDLLNDVIAKMKFPQASQIIDKMNIDVQYAEFTVEDLSNEEFINWFKAKGLFNKILKNEIGEFQKAYTFE